MRNNASEGSIASCDSSQAGKDYNSSDLRDLCSRLYRNSFSKASAAALQSQINQQQGRQVPSPQSHTPNAKNIPNISSTQQGHSNSYSTSYQSKSPVNSHNNIGRYPNAGYSSPGKSSHLPPPNRPVPKPDRGHLMGQHGRKQPTAARDFLYGGQHASGGDVKATDTDGSVTPPLPPLSPDLSPSSSAESILLSPHDKQKSISADVLNAKPSMDRQKQRDPMPSTSFQNGRYHRQAAPQQSLPNINQMGNPVTSSQNHYGYYKGGVDVSVDSSSLASFSEDGMTSDQDNGPHSVVDGRNMKKSLETLESMYYEIVKLLQISHENGTGNTENYGKSGHIFAKAGKNLKAGLLMQHQKAKDVKSINKRFARLESHVVTLARSVAHLSSEMRAHGSLWSEIETLKKEVSSIRRGGGVSNFNPSMPSNSTGNNKPMEEFRSTVPAMTNPFRINKLTRFFGEEPPFLELFLKKLGYEKYLTNFEIEKISMVELPYLTEERLQKIGVPMGPRLRILQEAQLSFRQENFTIYIV